MAEQHPDLFGGSTPVIAPAHSPYQDFRQRNRYRHSENEERCGTCRYCTTSHSYTKTYYKCELMGVSASEASDIRLRDVCDRWDQRFPDGIAPDIDDYLSLPGSPIRRLQVSAIHENDTLLLCDNVQTGGNATVRLDRNKHGKPYWTWVEFGIDVQIVREAT